MSEKTAKIPIQERGIFKALLKLGDKMSNQRHLSAISKGMMSTMPMLLIGAVFQIICIIPLDIIQNNTSILLIPYNMTMGMFSIVVVFAIAYQLAKSYKMKALMNGATAMIVFLMTVAPQQTVLTGMTNAEGVFEQIGSFSGLDITYLGSQGLFVAMIVAVVCVEVTRFCINKKIIVRMPDMIPPAMGEAFTALIPMLFSTLIFFVINQVLIQTMDNTLPAAIMSLLGIPLSAVNSVWGMLLVVILGALLWCFGVHGTMIVLPFIMPMSIMAAEANAAAVAAGQAASFYPSMLFGTIQIVGGTGCTLGLVLLGLRSKSEQIKAVSKASLVPGFCCINEPVAFGMPIVFNPILMIPYVLAPVACFFLQWGAYAIGFIKPAYIAINSLMPMGVASFIGSGMNIFNLIFPYLLIPVTMLIYYPFFKVYEAQLVKKERAIKEAESAAAKAN